MPMSGAAIEGISRFGRGWRYEIRMGDLTSKMGEMNDNTPDAEVEVVAKAIVERVKAWLVARGSSPRADEQMINRIEQTVEELEFLSDCGIEEVRGAMSGLYDDFDYYRVCALS